MSDLVAEALRWDMTVVSRRYVKSPSTGAVLSGMHGEWFSIAAGSYCALRKRTEPEASEKKASELEELILGEMNREAAILGELLQSRDGIGVLAAATSIAHNLGDLDRVMDQWNLDPSDPLRKTAYKSGHEGRDRFQGLLWLAGELNKATLSPTSMADENHRHFALRSNKCLRRSPDFLLPISPFFDSWGATIGRHPMLQPEEVAEIVRALMDGWERVKPSGRTQAYPRALAGIESTFNGGLSRLCNYLPSKDAKTLRAGALRTACSLDRRRFEDTWSQQALKLADRLRIA